MHSLKERRPDRQRNSQDSEQQFNWSQTGEVLKVKWHHNFHRGRAQTNGARLCLKDQPQRLRSQRHEERNPVVPQFGGGGGAAAPPCAEAATHSAKPKHDTTRDPPHRHSSARCGWCSAHSRAPAFLRNPRQLKSNRAPRA
ncbi:MAG: hypothetical protein DME18_15790 [Verrucomicrobia bacterium]|nr:MAG: hypothetical protein DME18_15790 [Verrucomicrobiota bacterium]